MVDGLPGDFVIMSTSTRVDFKNSRLFWNHGTKESHGVFNIESVLRIYRNDEIKETFVLATGVLAGNMYTSERLVQDPPYYFQVAASRSRHIIYRTDTINKPKWGRLFNRKKRGCTNDTPNNNSVFTSLKFKIIEEKCISVGPAYASLRKHYMQLPNFTSKIVINIDKEQKVELEFPIKHINISPENEMFQVETGALLFINKECSDLTDIRKSLIPSFVHFNSFNHADFSIDFPYGVRESTVRGQFDVKRLECKIELYSDKLYQSGI